MSWRVKRFIRKWAPIVGVVAALFVGYTHHERGGRATVSSVLTSARIAATKVPVLGTYFKKNTRRSYRSSRRYYGRGNKSYAYKKKARRSRKGKRAKRYKKRRR